MPSKIQKGRGYPLPTVLDPEGTVCLKITIPDDDGFRQALFAQLVDLGKWWAWKRDETSTKATQAAQAWRDKFTLEEEGCMLDCDEVEACIVDSPTITGIQTEIDGIGTAVTGLTDTVTEIQDGGIGTQYPTTYPEPATTQACNAANYIADQIESFISSTEGALQAYPDIQDYIENFFSGTLGVNVEPYFDLLDLIYNLTHDSVAELYSDQKQDVINYLYCNFGSKDALEAWMRTELTEGNAIADFVACIANSSYSKWVAIGKKGSGGACDSCEPCPIFGVYDFTQGELCWYPYLTGIWTVNGFDSEVTGASSELRIRRDFDAPIDIYQVKVRAYQLVSQGAFFYIELLDASDNVLASDNSLEIHNAPDNFTFTFSETGVSKIRIHTYGGNTGTQVYRIDRVEVIELV